MREQILEELIEYHQRPKLRDDEVVVRQYLESWNRANEKKLDVRQARRHLNKLVDVGTMEKRLVFHDSRWTNAYRRCDNECP